MIVRFASIVAFTAGVWKPGARNSRRCQPAARSLHTLARARRIMADDESLTEIAPRHVDGESLILRAVRAAVISTLRESLAKDPRFDTVQLNTSVRMRRAFAGTAG